MAWRSSTFWKNASPSELLHFFASLETQSQFSSIAGKMLEDETFCDLVFEYLWLLRREPESKSFWNHPEIPKELCIRFIYFGYGRQFLRGETDSSLYFDEIRALFDSAQSLRILSLADEMDRDPTLKIHMLSNLDPHTWEAYFDLLDEQNMTMRAILGIFTNLREVEIKKILLNSPTLYYYLRMMLLSEGQKNSESKDETRVEKERIELIISGITVWESYCQRIKDDFDLAKEREKPPNKRDSKRLSRHLQQLTSIPKQDRDDILTYFKGSGIVFDSWEETTIKSALENFEMEGKFF